MDVFAKLHKKPLFWIIITVLIIIPILVSTIVSLKTPFGLNIAGNADSWVGFYGNYFGAILGAIIGAIIALYVVFLESNSREKENRRQINLERFIELSTIFHEAMDAAMMSNEFIKRTYETRINCELDYNEKKTYMKAYGDSYSDEMLKYHKASLRLVSLMKICEICYLKNNEFILLHDEIIKFGTMMHETNDFLQENHPCLVSESENSDSIEKREKIVVYLSNMDSQYSEENILIESFFERFAHSIEII